MKMEMRDVAIVVLKCAGFLVCSAAFFIQISTAWWQYQEEATVTSVSARKNETMYLPCLTFCPYPVFKEAVYPLTNEEFENYSYQAADIFSKETLETLKNRSTWNVTKVSGPLIGNCFTTQYLHPVPAFDVDMKYNIKKNLDYQLFIHNPGEGKMAFHMLEKTKKVLPLTVLI